MELNKLNFMRNKCDNTLSTHRDNLLNNSIIKSRVLDKLKHIENALTIEFQDYLIKSEVTDIYKGESNIHSSLEIYISNVNRLREEVLKLKETCTEESNSKITDLEIRIEEFSHKIDRLKSLDAELKSKLTEIYGEDKSRAMTDSNIDKLKSF